MTDKPTVHRLKTWPEYFTQVWDGHKTFEIRIDDRGYKVGDVLLLQEYWPKHQVLEKAIAHQPKHLDEHGGIYTGRAIECTVTYILVGDGTTFLHVGFVAMSIRIDAKFESLVI